MQQRAQGLGREGGAKEHRARDMENMGALSRSQTFALGDQVGILPDDGGIDQMENRPTDVLSSSRQ